MGPTASGRPWPDPAFDENQKRVSPQLLAAHAGQHVAWSWDGARLVASAASEAALREQLRLAGVDSQSVVFDYLDAPGEGNW